MADSSPITAPIEIKKTGNRDTLKQRDTLQKQPAEPDFKDIKWLIVVIFTVEKEDVKMLNFC